MLSGCFNILKHIVKALPWRRKVATTEHFRIFYFYRCTIFICNFVQNWFNISLISIFLKEYYILYFDIICKVVLMLLSVACFGVRVSVMFHLMIVHYTFNSFSGG